MDGVRFFILGCVLIWLGTTPNEKGTMTPQRQRAEVKTPMLKAQVTGETAQCLPDLSGLLLSFTGHTEWITEHHGESQEKNSLTTVVPFPPSCFRFGRGRKVKTPQNSRGNDSRMPEKRVYESGGFGGACGPASQLCGRD